MEISHGIRLTNNDNKWINMTNNNLKKQLEFFNSGEFDACKNRNGIRRQTGQLLEKYYCQLVAKNNIPITIEVGAHEATFSKTSKELNPACECFAYEANPYVYKKYCEELKKLGVDYQNLAINDSNNDIELSIPIKLKHRFLGLDNRISSIHKRDQPNVEYEVVKVKANRLDSLFEKNHQLKALWIDVEGAQYEVLSSFGSMWSSVAFIYIEIEHRNVWSNNFDIKNINNLFENHGFVEIMRDNLARGQYNAVFTDLETSRHELTVEMVNSYISDINKLV